MSQWDVLFQSIEFEWDDGNRYKNWKKHKVMSFEAEQAFFNKPFVVADDEAHSVHEERYKALGKTDRGRLLFVVFTVRAKKIRIISVRDMTSKERKVYHEKENTTF